MKHLLNRLRNLGPGLLVTAAFIGPGTVTAASKAGADYRLALLWAVMFSLLATIVLQEMAARLGIVSRRGLGEAVRTSFRSRYLMYAAIGLVILAIGFGNAAYQTGNLTGAASGVEQLTGISYRIWTLVIAALAFGLLLAGAYRWIERVLIGLVIVMSLVFLATAALVKPDPVELLRGAFIPSFPTGSVFTVVALIGTTVVPYNLFLHASSVQEKWPESFPRREALSLARWDTTLAVVLGGMVTAAIVTTAAAASVGSGEIKDAADMARQLEPLLGAWAESFFAIGLLAAGLTSAITAPLAAAYAVGGVLGWPRDLKDRRLRGVWMAVMLLGALVAATLGESPTEVIVVAQIANGLLLPLIAALLLWAVNRKDLMGEYRNGLGGNVIGVAVVLVTSLLAANIFRQVFLGLAKVWSE